MLKILWKRGEIAPEKHFLLLFTIFSYLVLDFYVETRIGFSLRDKRLFEITEVEITRVDCNEQTGAVLRITRDNRENLEISFLLFHKTCCDHSFERWQQDGSNEGTRHMFLLRN